MPPLAQYQNGIIRMYYIKFTPVNSTGTWFQLTVQNQYLLIDNLQSYGMYACRVAAYTVGRGPFSEPLTIIPNSESGMSKTHAVTCTMHAYHDHVVGD